MSRIRRLFARLFHLVLCRIPWRENIRARKSPVYLVSCKSTRVASLTNSRGRIVAYQPLLLSSLSRCLLTIRHLSSASVPLELLLCAPFLSSTRRYVANCLEESNRFNASIPVVGSVLVHPRLWTNTTTRREWYGNAETSGYLNFTVQVS